MLVLNEIPIILFITITFMLIIIVLFFKKKKITLYIHIRDLCLKITSFCYLRFRINSFNFSYDYSGITHSSIQFSA